MKRENKQWLFALICGAVVSTTSLETVMAAGYSGRVEGNAAVCARHDVMRVAQGPEYQYQQKIYYFCYPACLEQFKSAPERFHLAKDPVTGELVDKAQALLYAVEGKIYYFSGEEHLKAFSENPDAYLNSIR